MVRKRQELPPGRAFQAEELQCKGPEVDVYLRKDRKAREDRDEPEGKRRKKKARDEKRIVVLEDFVSGKSPRSRKTSWRWIISALSALHVGVTHGQSASSPGRT